MPQDFEIIGEITEIGEIEEAWTAIPNTSRFAICVRSSDDSHVLKVYAVIDDPDAEQHGMLRIIDESGEDYLHATERFIVVTLPRPAANALVHAMKTAR